MKKLFKNPIFTFILGAVIFSAVSVLAYSLLAGNVGFTPFDTSWKRQDGTDITNVEEALNELYRIRKGVLIWNEGNPLNVTLHNGCAIVKDDENDYYLSFDGLDDYAQIDTLPASINWQDGFSVEFMAKWDALNNWSRIFDFGVGQNNNNIFVSNYETSSNMSFSSRVGSTIYFEGSTVNMTLTNKARYKIVVTKNTTSNYTFNFYQNDNLVRTQTLNGSFANVARTRNLIGGSNWSQDSYFKGRIYYLKITLTDGTKIVDLDLNKLYRN